MSKWKCVSRKESDRKDFTIGKVYELKDDDTLVCNSGYIFGENHQNKRCGGTIKWLESNGVIMVEVKDMNGFNFDELKTGDVIFFDREYYNGSKTATVLRGVPVDKGDFIRFNRPEDKCCSGVVWDFEDFSKEFNRVLKIERPNTIAGICSWAGDNCDRKVIYENCKREMTIEEIEKALGYSVKIIKEK